VKEADRRSIPAGWRLQAPSLACRRPRAFTRQERACTVRAEERAPPGGRPVPASLHRLPWHTLCPISVKPVDWWRELRVRLGLRECRKQSGEARRLVRRGCPVFADPLSLNMPSSFSGCRRGTGFSLSPTRSDRREHASSARAKPLGANAMTTKKARSKAKLDSDRDTIEPEYDFAKAVRGATAARYAKGTNAVVLDPELRELFPTSEAINEALRELAAIAKRAGRVKRGRRSA